MEIQIDPEQNRGHTNAQVIPDIQVNKHAWEFLMGIGNGEQKWEWGMGIQIDPEQNRGDANVQVMMPDIHFLKKIKKT